MKEGAERTRTWSLQGKSMAKGLPSLNALTLRQAGKGGSMEAQAQAMAWWHEWKERQTMREEGKGVGLDIFCGDGQPSGLEQRIDDGW